MYTLMMLFFQRRSTRCYVPLSVVPDDVLAHEAHLRQEREALLAA